MTTYLYGVCFVGVAIDVVIGTVPPQIPPVGFGNFSQFIPFHAANVFIDGTNI